jgi:hypothetical protein
MQILQLIEKAAGALRAMQQSETAILRAFRSEFRSLLLTSSLSSRQLVSLCQGLVWVLHSV